MTSLDEIKRLPAKEKWLIYEALQGDVDVLSKLS